MRLVVADTSPLRYLVQIGLPRLFEEIFLSSVVADELHDPSAPPAVRVWMRQPPAWLQVIPVVDVDDPALEALDHGERSAIALGLSLGADLILIDERKGAAAAVNKDSKSPERSAFSIWPRNADLLIWWMRLTA
jgi:predicted nucleic acid-binding protein